MNKKRGQLSLLASFLALFRKSRITCKADGEEHCPMEIGSPTNMRHDALVTSYSFDGFLGLPIEFEPQVARRAPIAKLLMLRHHEGLLVPNAQHYDLMAITLVLGEQIELMLLVRLPPPSEAALLDWVVNLMADSVQQEHLNKMNAPNIAMVFASNMTQLGFSM